MVELGEEGDGPAAVEGEMEEAVKEWAAIRDEVEEEEGDDGVNKGKEEDAEVEDDE
jgi:hypothetical protein